MPRFQYVARRVALAAIAAAALASCDDDKKELLGVDTSNRAGGSLFDSYVALGNSLTAGWQSGGINDSTQRQSYAYLLAKQAGARFVYPSLAKPGCPIPATNFGDVVAQTCAFRIVRANEAPLNNVGVPLAFLFDSSLAFPYDTTRSAPTGFPRRSTTAAANALQTIILGGETQIQRAVDARATFVSLWIGNNDVLAPASVGLLTGVAGQAPPLLPTASYTNAAKFVVDSLARAVPTIRGGIIIGVVNVGGAPRFFSGSALWTGTGPTAPGTPTALAASISTITGKTVTILPNCAGSTNLISTVLIEQIKNFDPTTTPARGYPPVISCEPATVPGVPTSAQLGNFFILSGPEQTAISAAVKAINDTLLVKANQYGWAFYDPNNTTNGLPALKTAGIIPSVPNFTDPKNPFGLGISVDGVHPRRPVSALVTNALIDVINAKYQLSIPKITDTTSPVDPQ
ncbi:MAG TPA: hypothetical protein VKA84_17080 [Gemmatimonadaceae bacterium]|nr:hypothetical protein [Gemmatimonadaceae bacterium]